MIFFDTETVGLHGMAITIQYSINDGPIIIHEVWRSQVKDTLKLIETFANHPKGVCGFNIAFDWFHLCKLYTTFRLLDFEIYPEDHIDLVAEMEALGRDGPCLKPVTACDLMLFARKGPYQSTMDRSDIRIKKIPTVLANSLCNELEKRVPLRDIYFARRKNKWESHFKVVDREDEDGEYEPDFKDIVLKFNASSALKALAVDALGITPDKVLLFADVDIDKKLLPVEVGYAPFAMAHKRGNKWMGSWPEVIKYHISHWAFNSLAREYAAKDVEYTRALYKHFGCPESDDDDSVLACMVGAARWKGYSIDIEGIKKLRESAIRRMGEFPTAPAQSRKYIEQHLSETEKVVIKGSTKRTILEEISTFEPVNGVPHPAAKAAEQVLGARKAAWEVDLFDKLLFAGRFHASFVVIGTLSSRMAGADKLNAQGIKKTKSIREKFTLNWPGYVLTGGDFEGFEVVLADAVYNDPGLREDLLSGKKIHGLFGVFVYPHMTYEEILASSGTDDDKYTRAKSAVFAMLYGGEGFTLKERLGVPIETANAAYEKFCRRYPGVGIARKKVIDMFQTLKQIGGIGSRITYSEPADFIESLFGFRRYFTLENQIVKALVELAQNPPKNWNMNIKVVRRDREQYVQGAVQSALYGAAFAMQASNTRAAANHVIQSSGAQTTKLVQRKIWDLQPAGIGEWKVQPMNIHDEIMCVTCPSLVDKVEEVVNETVESIRPRVPLIKMEWEKDLSSWADK